MKIFTYQETADKRYLLTLSSCIIIFLKYHTQDRIELPRKFLNEHIKQKNKKYMPTHTHKLINTQIQFEHTHTQLDTHTTQTNIHIHKHIPIEIHTNKQTHVSIYCRPKTLIIILCIFCIPERWYSVWLFVWFIGYKQSLIHFTAKICFVQAKLWTISQFWFIDFSWTFCGKCEEKI